jgi:hypothetical protein
MNRISKGTCKVRNEIETKRNRTKRNETKRNETKRDVAKKTKRNQTKRNETDRYETKCNEKKWIIQYGMKTKRVYNILIIQIYYTSAFFFLYEILNNW